MWMSEIRIALNGAPCGIEYSRHERFLRIRKSVRFYNDRVGICDKGVSEFMHLGSVKERWDLELIVSSLCKSERKQEHDTGD